MFNGVSGDERATGHGSIDDWLRSLKNTPSWRAAVSGYIERFEDEDIDMEGLENVTTVHSNPSSLVTFERLFERSLCAHRGIT